MQPKADTQIGLSQIVQQDTTSGIEVTKHMQLFFNLPNCKMLCSSEICITSTAVYYSNDVPCSVDNSSNVKMRANDKGFLSIIAMKNSTDISRDFYKTTSHSSGQSASMKYGNE